MSGVTLDAGALIAFERDDRRMIALLADAARSGDPVTVPAPVVAQVLRRPSRQVSLVRLLRQASTTTVSLDRADASLVGQLLGRSATTDIADAHVVICAERAGQPVLTSDPDDLRRLSRTLEIVPL